MNRKKTALYCRVAARPMCDDIAMLTQKEFLLRYAEEQGYENTELYEDNGVSGLSMFNRSAFKRMQTAIEAGEVERVIVRSLSRVGRNTHDVYRWLSDLNARGVEFVTADSPMMTNDLLRKLFDELGWGLDADE
jgi:DNA invertase Pin-like site-specific DNA recombinase